MTEITIRLSESAYQRLLTVARTCRKSPEEWLQEQVDSNLTHSPMTAAEARQIAAVFLQKRVGLLLVPKRASFKAKQGVWNISVIPNVKLSEAKSRVAGMTNRPLVGQMQVDAQSGKVLTSVAEITTMMRVAEAFLGMEGLPLEKQERLRVLRALSSQGKLTEVQQEELNQLVVEAERYTQANLRRWGELVRVPPSKRREFKRLMDEAERMEAHIHG